MTFNIIKHAGDPKKATLADGTVIHREEKLYIPEWEVFVACAPYSSHFVYMNPVLGQSAYMCTCGSPAVITPPGPEGLMVCLFHATHGFHTTSVINKKDFSEKAGQTIEVDPKGKKWI